MKKLILLLILLLNFSVFAQEAIDESEYSINFGDTQTIQDENIQTNQGQYRTVGFKEIFKFILVFAFIIFIIFMFMRLLKKVSSPAIADNDEIHLISTSALAGGRLVHIINVGTEFYLIGSTDTEVNLISKIENEQTINSLQLKKEELPLNKKNESFSDKLLKSLGMNKEEPSEGLGKETFNFLKKQKDKLKNLK